MMNDLKYLPQEHSEPEDHDECACCGTQEMLELDHILPLAKGGKNVPRNLQLLCKRCNVSKGTHATCQIQHEPNHHELADVNRYKQDGQASPPQPFSTRLSPKKKALLLQQAKVRGVAAGVIIEELMDASASHQGHETLRRIEAKLDLLITSLHDQAVYEAPQKDYSMFPDPVPQVPPVCPTRRRWFKRFSK